MSEPLVLRVAFLLWQANQGYIKAEDRNIGEGNWFLEPIEALHVDDAAERPGWIEMAEEVVAAVKAEMA